MVHLQDDHEFVPYAVFQEDRADLCELHALSQQQIEAGAKNVLITTVQRIQQALGCPWDDPMGQV